DNDIVCFYNGNFRPLQAAAVRLPTRTEVYTKVFALDVAARHRVQFSMPESDAVTMLKNRHA
ncbi:hypothetical protein ACQ9AP_25445, partial [Escherichia coli]|uniref:hypothetical protein n=1 Tax=Escherichia coli TaxID=562 RepID=UPI003D35E50E